MYPEFLTNAQILFLLLSVMASVMLLAFLTLPAKPYKRKIKDHEIRKNVETRGSVKVTLPYETDYACMKRSDCNGRGSR